MKKGKKDKKKGKLTGWDWFIVGLAFACASPLAAPIAYFILKEIRASKEG